MDHIEELSGLHSGGSDSEGDRASFFNTHEFAQRDSPSKARENYQRKSQSQPSRKHQRPTSKRPTGGSHRVLQPLRGKEFGPQVQGRKQQDEDMTTRKNTELKKLQQVIDEMQKENASLKRKSEADEKKLTSKKMRGGGSDTWAVLENREMVTYFKQEAKTTSWKQCKFLGSKSELQELNCPLSCHNFSRACVTDITVDFFKGLPALLCQFATTRSPRSFLQSCINFLMCALEHKTKSTI